MIYRNYFVATIIHNPTGDRNAMSLDNTFAMRGHAAIFGAIDELPTEVKNRLLKAIVPLLKSELETLRVGDDEDRRLVLEEFLTTDEQVKEELAKYGERIESLREKNKEMEVEIQEIEKTEKEHREIRAPLIQSLKRSIEKNGKEILRLHEEWEAKESWVGAKIEELEG